MSCQPHTEITLANEKGVLGVLTNEKRVLPGHVIHKEARHLEVALGELALDLLLGPEVVLHVLPIQSEQLPFIRCFTLVKCKILLWVRFGLVFYLFFVN